MKECVKLGLN